MSPSACLCCQPCFKTLEYVDLLAKTDFIKIIRFRSRVVTTEALVRWEQTLGFKQ